MCVCIDDLSPQNVVDPILEGTSWDDAQRETSFRLQEVSARENESCRENRRRTRKAK